MRGKPKKSALNLSQEIRVEIDQRFFKKYAGIGKLKILPLKKVL